MNIDASTVADMSTVLNEGEDEELFLRESSTKSKSELRSCTSSSNRCVQGRGEEEDVNMRRSTPYVMKRTCVVADCLVSPLTA